MTDVPNIRAKKSLWQNFLLDEEALSDISSSIDISNKDIVEVGPGYGALTDYILEKKPASLTLIEIDTDMIEILERKYAHTDIIIKNQDILQYLPELSEYSVIANIPYYITSPILFYFLYSTTFAPPKAMTIMMQEEVGEKILEWRHPKKPHHSFLSLAMEEACDDIEIVRYVWRSAFEPRPKVDSIVLLFTVKEKRDRTQEVALIALWKVVFAHPRKTLLSNIKASIHDVERFRSIILELGYDERVRAEAISREDWKKFL